MSSLSDDYELFDDQPTGFARWVLPALIISLMAHVIFYMWARDYTVNPFSEAYYDEMVPLKFHLERVEIDPEVLREPTLAEESTPAAAPDAIKPPEETISFEKLMGEVRATPTAPEIENPMLAETPRVEETTLATTVQSAETSGAQSVVRDLDALREELIVDNPEISGRPLLELAAGASSGTVNVPEGSLAGGDTPGFSNLDDLLAETGPLTNETAPIMMPADLMFDYDSYQLRSGALSSLGKLGMIIQRNPGATFVIEGHSDSFGTAAYNVELSSLRAESVKAWLVSQMGIDPTRVQTKGFGSSQLIAPASGSIDEQQINRRVEIVIRAAGSGR